MQHTATDRVIDVGRAPPRGVLATLCLTQIVGWGVLYYAFPVAMPEITSEEGWSRTAVMGAFSLALIVAAIAGIVVGRLIDRRGPRLVMTAGSVLGAVAMLVVSWAPSIGWFVAGWLISGLAQSAVLYPPAFAALTRWYGTARVRALMVLTVVGGFASTVFAPLTAGLLDVMGWRQAFVVLAAILAITTIPAHAWGLRAPWPDIDGSAHRYADRPRRHAYARGVMRSRPFLALVLSMTLAAFAFGSAAVNLVPSLTAQGWTATAAAWALGVTGAAQVLGRLGYARIAIRTSPRVRSLAVPLLAAAPVVALALTVTHGAVVVACVAFGILRGMFTLVESTAISDRWGIRDYGRLYGVLSAPAVTALAIAPWAGTVIADRLAGYPSLFLVLAAILGLSAAAAFATGPSSSPAPAPSIGSSRSV